MFSCLRRSDRRESDGMGHVGMFRSYYYDAREKY